MCLCVRESPSVSQALNVVPLCFFSKLPVFLCALGPGKSVSCPPRWYLWEESRNPAPAVWRSHIWEWEDWRQGLEGFTIGRFSPVPGAYVLLLSIVPIVSCLPIATAPIPVCSSSCPWLVFWFRDLQRPPSQYLEASDLLPSGPSRGQRQV